MSRSMDLDGLFGIDSVAVITDAVIPTQRQSAMAGDAARRSRAIRRERRLGRPFQNVVERRKDASPSEAEPRGLRRAFDGLTHRTCVRVA